MKALEEKKRKQTAILTAIILSCLLFVAGLVSGLYVSKRVEEKQRQDVTFLVDYVNTLDSDLKSFQLQEKFFDSLNKSQSCAFSETYFSQVAANLNYYWNVLPARLEAYEQDRALSEQYIKLKQEYTTLSIRAWLISRNNFNTCETNIIPVLYFYATDCKSCIEQGERLDEFRENMLEQNKTIVVFTIDKNDNEPTVQLIRQYYEVSQVPAVITNEHTLQGRVFTSEEIERLLS